MTDELEKLFDDLRTDTLREIVAPGAPQARATVRRKRTLVVSAATGLTTAAVLIGIGLAARPGSGGNYVAGQPGSASPSGLPSLLPNPSPLQSEYDLLADTPKSISSTAGIVSSYYEGHENDMPADTYAFHYFCLGSGGTVRVVIKLGNSGNTVLGQGTAICTPHNPAPLRLTIRQPSYGWLRLYAYGDAKSDNRAGFSFEFLSTTGKTHLTPQSSGALLTPSSDPKLWLSTRPSGALLTFSGSLPVTGSPSN